MKVNGIVVLDLIDFHYMVKNYFKKYSRFPQKKKNTEKFSQFSLVHL